MNCSCTRHTRQWLIRWVFLLTAWCLIVSAPAWSHIGFELKQETTGTPDTPPPNQPSPPESPLEPEETQDQTPTQPAMKIGDMIEKEGPGVTAPVPVKVPKPRYSSHAMRKRARGRVIVGVLVDEHGKVTKVVIKKGHLDFNVEAEKAARGAIFKPATKDGIAGKMWTELRFNFLPN